MGGSTFTHYADGTNVKSAFDTAHDHADYDDDIKRKGDYTVVATGPVLLTEAYNIADQLINANDKRISDKWGPAGAIPILSEERKLRLKETFGYTPTPGHRQGVDPALLEAIEPQLKLKRGESVKNVQVLHYSTPDVNRYGNYRAPSRFRAQCQAEVVISLPPMTRTETVSVIVPGNLDHDALSKAVVSEVDARLKLKTGEKRIDHRVTKKVPGKPKVTVEAPKLPTETRFIIKGCRTKHDSWENGFPTQAKARAYLTGVVENPANWASNGPLAYLGDDVTLEVESVTRRVDGSPLVSVRREVAGHILDVDVTIRLATAKADKADGWLFFGWVNH